MKVIDQVTGKSVTLFPTTELRNDLQVWDRGFSCTHDNKVITKKQIANGDFQLRHQCTNCGKSIGNAIKQDARSGNMPFFNEELGPAFEAKKKQRREAIIQNHLTLQRKRETSSQIKYDAYLASPEWKAKRKKVFGRANGICEGCGEHVAREVHHLSYDHIFDEFLFELVALCKICHDKVHAEVEEDESENTVEIDIEVDELPCASCRYQAEENDQPWCFLLDISSADALAENGACGPDLKKYENLK